MKAGALHTTLADGVWTPRRAHNIEQNINGDCLLCGEKNAGVNHLWWDAERSTDILILVISSSCKSDIESTTNHN
eukprot:4138310-Heterocapsa_arctica.AAC.1